VESQLGHILEHFAMGTITKTHLTNEQMTQELVDATIDLLSAVVSSLAITIRLASTHPMLCTGTPQRQGNTNHTNTVKQKESETIIEEDIESVDALATLHNAIKALKNISTPQDPKKSVEMQLLQ